jgi:uncharacterized membrane protein YGL010W
MPSLGQHFTDYEAHHRRALNKAAHSVGIPLIAVALLGLASEVQLYALPDGPFLDLGITLAAALVTVYLTWHVGLAVGVALLLVPLYLVGAAIPTGWLWIILAVGVVLLYVGHFVFERRSPAFHKNAIHMLIGPLWMAARLFSSLGLYRFDTSTTDTGS